MEKLRAPIFRYTEPEGQRVVVAHILDFPILTPARIDHVTCFVDPPRYDRRESVLDSVAMSFGLAAETDGAERHIASKSGLDYNHMARECRLLTRAFYFRTAILIERLRCDMAQLSVQYFNSLHEFRICLSQNDP